MAEPAPQDAAQDPLKELIDRLDRARSSLPQGADSLAGRIAALAASYTRPLNDRDLPYERTNIAYALEDFERVAGPIQVDPDLRADLANRAATNPQLRTNRFDTLLETTPDLADQALVDRIRQAATDTAERLFQDVPVVYDQAAALEADVALARRVDPRPTPTIADDSARSTPADPRVRDPSAEDPHPVPDPEPAADARTSSLTRAQRELASFDREPPEAAPIRDPAPAAPADAPAEPTASDPIKAVVSQLDRLRPEIEDQDQNLATRIEQLAFDADHQPPGKEQKFATLVAYALQDAERQGHRIPIDPDLHKRLDTLASTYPGLEHPRLKELVASTPSIEDPDLVEEIRYTAQVAADSTDQNSSAISYLVGKLESRLAQNADRARPNPARPANAATFGTPPAALAPAQVDGPSQPAPQRQAPAQVPRAATPATTPAPGQARDQPQPTSSQPNPATQDQRASPEPRTQVQIGGLGGLVAGALATVRQPKVPEQAEPEKAAPKQAAPRSWLDNSQPFGHVNNVVFGNASETDTRSSAATANLSSINPNFETNVMAPRRDAASIDQARNAGIAARDALTALHKNPGETVLKRIQAAAAQTQGGIHEVLSEMRQGGKYQDLREAFDSALTKQDDFSSAYKDATAKLGRYADQRTKVAPIVDKQPNSTAISAQLQQLDAEVGEVADLLPSQKEGQSALEDLKDHAAEFFEKTLAAIKSLFKRDPSAAPASRPSPSPGP